MTLFDKFVAEFGPKLYQSQRWPAFQFIAKELLSYNQPYILETGCLRQVDNWMGDGQSTRLWSWIVQNTDGMFWSVDINDENVAKAGEFCPPSFCQVTMMDSIKFLRTGQCEWPELLNLLYLDSYDFVMPGYDAMLHHIGELAAIYGQLPHGCLIAVDDCHSATSGKHVMIKNFFALQGISPVFESYITIWRKP